MLTKRHDATRAWPLDQFSELTSWILEAENIVDYFSIHGISSDFILCGDHAGLTVY